MAAESISKAQLRKFSIFRALSDKEVEMVLGHISIVRVGKGETVISHLDDGADVYLLLEGQLIANRYSSAGREISYRRIPPNSYFGEMAVIDGEPRSMNIIALTDVKLGFLPEAAFRSLMESSNAFMQALLQDLAVRVRDLSDRIFEASAASVKMRLFSELVRTAMAHGVTDNVAILENPPTHAEWAALVGGQRETVTRAFNELTSAGLMKKAGRDIVITDMDGLLDIVEDL